MNVTKTAVVALIAFSGVAIPTTGAVHAGGDQPLLCGLIDPCDGTTSDGDAGDSEPEPAPVDIDIDLQLDVDLDVVTPHHDSGIDTDVQTNADVELLPSNGTLLTASADVTKATAQADLLDHTLAAATQAALDTDATVGHGVVLSANGAASSQAAANVAGRQLVTADAVNRLCGIQVVIATTSSADCSSSGSGGGSATTGRDGLVAVAESFDLCGAHVVVAGSATTQCGGSSANSAPGMGSSWTLADAAVSGSVCGLSVAVAGRSSASCSATAHESPVPGADPNGPGTGTPGTGSGVGSSPAAQPQQAAGGAAGDADGGADGAGDGSSAGDSNGSLPLTGASLLMILMIAGASLAAGLVAVRSSRVRFGHQS